MHIEYLCDRPEFIEELAELNFNEWGEFAPGDSLQARIELMRSACGKGEIPSVVVALQASELLGGALLIDSDLEVRPELTPWLAGVYVKTEHRGKGVASRLINHVVEEARKLGVAQLYLYTDTSQSLYARLGWEVVEELVYEGLPVVVMKFRLCD
ncbi:GNAT family N-acetyltransferase [Pseudomonas sp. R1-1]|uniref:GNAT family N-acetyltransferase n=1 Tax=Pseudomonas sp. R1-1 TaxID=1602529 RepID=UPI003DA88BB4